MSSVALALNFDPCAPYLWLSHNDKLKPYKYELINSTVDKIYYKVLLICITVLCMQYCEHKCK